ncbi:hypothetical protein [Ruminococcus sp.]|uniref:hypothetical protein n=1 Tax=Ruminococcus sp. TaxID=41978 RepID=UPI0025CEC996|nr:hypothetical protein [Ruminococcus sp.]MBR1433190.1 hypothetical protein [Ruminococcus sp.]
MLLNSFCHRCFFVLYAQNGAVQFLDNVSFNASFFYKTFSKKQPHYISLYSDEMSVPDEKSLRKLKKQTNLLNMIYNNMLSTYDGCLVVDGIAEDDWFDIGRLADNIDDNFPYGCIFIFGMNNAKLEKVCHDEEDFLLLQDYINEGKVVLCDSNLRDAINESGLITENDEEDDEHESEVRISLANADSLWVPRKAFSPLNRINITLMRDEILSQLILTDDNKERYFADFLQQRDKKDWRYFDISYKGEKMSFHVERHVEEGLIDVVTKQLGASNNRREIILLKGNSNSGKTTSLSWFAWHAVKRGFKKKKDEKYIVFYISGDPSYNDNEWQDILYEFIKNSINNKTTVKGDRIRNVIIVWDNYNSKNKKEDYVRLYNKLNECNAIIIGSIYSFESINSTASVVQGVAFNELKPLDSKLDGKSKIPFERLLKTIDADWVTRAPRSKDTYLFEQIINFTKFKYSPEWDQIRISMKAALSKEAVLSEDTSNNLFSIFKNKNADDFTDVTKTIFGLGIGAKIQSQFITANDEKQKKNTQFINSIRDMNLILAVAGQFNKTVRLPLSVLLRTILKETEYKGNHQKLNRILRSDSMVEYDANTSSGNILVSFRHPSEAIAYLENNYGFDRKKEEVMVVTRLIKCCKWEIYEEAQAVIALIRSFGSNSYGKYGEEKIIVRGHYSEYSEHWLKIVDELRKYASSNAEAMLVAGHFSREYVEQNHVENDLDYLQGAFKVMEAAVNSCDYKPTQSRLYGEMCRNLLQQIKISDNAEIIEGFFDDFEYYFKLAVENGLASKLSNNSVSTAQLLDIWLNYVLNDFTIHKHLIPDTLEYIDLLFYNESNLIDDNEDYVNVISNINNIYNIINSEQGSDLKELFSNSNNDSYTYCIAKQVLVKVYFMFRERYSNLFYNTDGSVLSSRIFFLNENAAEEFHQKAEIEMSAEGEEKRDATEILAEIKQELHSSSEEIITIIEGEYKALEDMSFRCLVLYLKAKWMSYTNNLLLEHGQTPALSDAQWFELNKICNCISTKRSDNYTVPRSVEFIQNIYGFVFEKKKWNQNRYSSESPNRLICLCTDVGTPRTFRFSFNEDYHNQNKLKASVDYEVINGEKSKKTSIVGQKNIYVPENIQNYRELKRNNLNIDRDFLIWFNLGGPQIQDNKSKEEV